MDQNKLLQLAKEGGDKLYRDAASSVQEHYGTVWSDGNYTYHPSRSCFGAWTQHMYADSQDGKRKALLFFFCHKNYIRHFPTDEAKKTLNEFLDWVMNRSPYADVFISKDPKEIADGPCFLRTDVQPQQMIGAAVLIRHRHQLPGLIKQWGVFRQHMNDDLAFYYASAYDMSGLTFHWHPKNHGHALVNTQSICPERLKNFLLHKIAASKKTVAEGNFDYTDYLSLWGSKAKLETSMGMVDVNVNVLAPTRKNFFTQKAYGLAAFPLKRIDDHISHFFKLNQMNMEKYALV